MEKLEIIWKDIPFYEGKYKISNEGEIYNLHINAFSKTSLDKDGYRIITLNKEGKSDYKRVARLVMAAFHGESDLQVDHINTIKDDDRLVNLRYVTARENSQYRTENKKGTVGAKYCKRVNKWISAIWIGKSFYYLGLYQTKEEAISVYNKAVFDWINYKIKPSKHIDPNKTSKYKGIYYSEKSDRWLIDFRQNGKRYIGRAFTEEEAFNKLKNMIGDDNK